MALRVLVVSREPVGRLGVETLVHREGMTVAGSVATGIEAADALTAATPDVIVLGRFVDREPILDEIRALRAASPGVPIVVLTARIPRRTFGAEDAMGTSWLSARAPAAEIAAALNAAAAGIVVLSRSHGRALFDAGNRLESGRPGPSSLPALG